MIHVNCPTHGWSPSIVLGGRAYCDNEDGEDCTHNRPKKLAEIDEEVGGWSVSESGRCRTELGHEPPPPLQWGVRYSGADMAQMRFRRYGEG